ncbi:MAG: hypothetical protein JNM89_02115 [Hyphomicrobiaceae bacterium]|nr:hypothetical protein [Hyphomicrobiaceae bacterium]
MTIKRSIATAMFGFMLAGAAPAFAAPMGGIADGRAVTESQIQTVHGWHRSCEQGPVRYHRHVPGVGNVPCGTGGGGYGRCAGWRNECGDRWGWGNWRFRQCMRNHGC